MAVLTLLANSASAINVTCQRAGKAAPRQVGGVSPSANGANRSTVRGQAKVIPIVTSYLTASEESAIQAAVQNGAQLNCSGDILGNVQTLCSIDQVTSDIVPGTSPELWEMRFTVNEVNASTVLLKYSPGDTITGESFSRSTTATYFDANGILRDAAINVKRDGHYGPYPSGTTRMTLLEDARTNHILWGCDFSNAAWTKSNVTVTTGVAGMRLGAQANTLTATANNAFVIQNPAASSSLVRTNSIWIRRRTGTGQVELYDTGGVAFQILSLTANYQRVRITSAANTGRSFQIVIRTSGDAIDVENAQVEDGAFASSEILTTTVAVTRGADSYPLPFPYPPFEMTVYAKFVEGGSAVGGAGRVFAITSAGDTFPEFIVYARTDTKKYASFHDNVAAAVESSLAPYTAPALGDTVEIVARLFGDGSTDITQSLNGAAATTATQSAALAFATAWAAQLCYLNSSGTVAGLIGFGAYQSLKIVAGSRSLSEMRAA